MPSPRPRRSSDPSLESLLDAHQMLLVFDGDCGLCHRAVQWVLKHDPDGPMRFASRSGRTGQMILRRLPALRDVDSVILVHRDGAWIKSTAALELARYVGGIWSLATAGYLLPRPLRDAVYDLVARHRQRLSRACEVHAEASRERLLD